MSKRLIDALELKRSIAASAVVENGKHIFDIIDEQPNIEPKLRWIPCSDRLPEELVAVNITWVNHAPVSYYKDIKDKPFTATGVYFKGKWYWWSATVQDYLTEYGRYDYEEFDESIECIAWMPLPDAYEVE